MNGFYMTWLGLASLLAQVWASTVFGNTLC